MAATITSMAVTTNSTNEVATNAIHDISSPYYLHSLDHPGGLLVSTPLTGDNYPTWSRAMKIALNAKNKLGFVNGSLKEPEANSKEHHTWDRCSGEQGFRHNQSRGEATTTSLFSINHYIICGFCRIHSTRAESLS